MKIVKILSVVLLSSFLLAASGVALAANDCGTAAGTEGRSCMDSSQGTSCLTGHCPGGTNIQCCMGETITVLGSSVETGTLNGFMQLALAVAKWILGISGSASLFMFVYGGVMFLISGGSSEKVSQAKSIIVGSVIGLIIVFSSYTIIGFIMGNVLGISKAQGGGWASSTWFK